MDAMFVGSVLLNGESGSDTFDVTPSAHTDFFVDGGDPIGFGDLLRLNAPTAMFYAGQESDEGSYQVTGLRPVSFDHIERRSVGDQTEVNLLIPIPSGGKLAIDSDTGRSQLDNVTSDNTPDVVFQLAPFVVDNSFQLGVEIHVTSAATGAVFTRQAQQIGQSTLWSANFDSVLPDGLYYVNADAMLTNATGEEQGRSAPSAAMLMIIDTQDPGGAEGEAADGPLTSAKPTFRGEGEPGAIIRAMAGGQRIGQAEADDSGTWTMKIQSPLPDGQYDVVFQSEDVAGNTDDGAADPLRILVDADNIVTLNDDVYQFLVEGDQLVINKGDEEMVRMRADTLRDLRLHATTQAEVQFGGGWTMPHTVLRNGIVYRSLELASARLLLNGPWNWQNPINRLDVSNDNHVSPLDALRIINELNIRKLSSPDGALPSATGIPSGFFMDVYGDGFVTPLDALIVINFLNSNTIGGEGEGPVDLSHQAYVMPIAPDQINRTMAHDRLREVHATVHESQNESPLDSPGLGSRDGATRDNHAPWDLGLPWTDGDDRDPVDLLADVDEDSIIAAIDEFFGELD